VRELENVIERAVILEDGARISLSSLPDMLLRGAGLKTVGSTERILASSHERATAMTPDDIAPLEEEERRIIRRALELTNWDAREASRRLRIGRATIYRKIERYRLRTS
jgi:transcriptional regulator of acetoin/glycerol metabolism